MFDSFLHKTVTGTFVNLAAKPSSSPLNSFTTEVPIIYKPVHWFAEQINDMYLRHERAYGYLQCTISYNRSSQLLWKDWNTNILGCTFPRFANFLGDSEIQRSSLWTWFSMMLNTQNPTKITIQNFSLYLVA